MKKYAWLILFFLAAKIISAQCETEVSKIDAEKDDTLKLKHYQKALDCFYNNDDFAGANKLLLKTKILSDKLIAATNDSVYYRSYLYDLTSFYYFSGDIKTAKDVSEKLVSYDYRKSDPGKLSSSIGNLAILYRRMGNYPKAVNLLLDAIQINEKNKKKDMSGNYTNIANVYTDLKNYSKAKIYLEKAMQVRLQLKDNEGLFNAYMNMGNYYQRVLKPDSALLFYNRCFILSSKTNLPKNKTGTIFNNLTALYIAKKNADSALYFSDIAKNILSEKAPPLFTCLFYLNKGLIEGNLTHYKVAIDNFNKALVIASKTHDLENQFGLLFCKSDCFSKLRQMDSAYYNFKQATKLKDSVFNSSKTAELTRYEMQYQFDKEQEEMKNNQLKKEIEVKHALERKQLLIYAALVALILLFGLVLLILRNNNQKKKDNLLLQQKNDLIESQKKDIIDSINYARNLQQAILPPLSKIKQELGDSFIYYKPKDIIAGDFYWMYKPAAKNNQEEIFLFAVADCTGHGVPGALVSVVCSNALDSAVKEHGLKDPGQILDKTKEIVSETFSKTGQRVKDGMDISLCAVKRQPGTGKITIQYAGANNSLWYIHKGEIKELVANKQPIGLSEHSRPFTTQALELDKGDTLYFSTDGYYDQFGGDTSGAGGKKFMRKRLSQLFFSIKDQPMAAQLATIDATFLKWKGALEQIDDVCVAAIKL